MGRYQPMGTPIKTNVLYGSSSGPLIETIKASHPLGLSSHCNHDNAWTVIRLPKPLWPAILASSH